MSRVLQVFLQTIIGTVVGALFWTPIVLMVIYSESYGNGKVPGFGGGSMDAKFLVIVGIVLALIHGFIVGLGTGLFGAITLIKGGVAGVVTIEIVIALFFIYIHSWIEHTNKGWSFNWDWLIGDIASFIVVSIFFFIPSVIIGMLTAKLFFPIKSLVNSNN